VDLAIGLWKPFGKERRERLELALADVAIDVGEDVLDEDLAPELFAEIADVAADDRSEIEQDRHLARRHGLQELVKGFGGKNRIVGGARRGSLGTDVGLAFTRC